MNNFNYDILNLNLRFQLAAVCVFILMIIDYVRNKHLVFLSSKCFRFWFIATGVNLVNDISTVISIQFYENYPIINRILHQLFIFSIIVLLFSHCLYVNILSNGTRFLNKFKLVILLLPLLMSIPIILFGDIKYFVDGNIIYSYGNMVYPILFCSVIYLAISYYRTIDKKSDLTNNQRGAIQIGLTVWTIIFIIQIVTKIYLLSGLGAVLMLLAVYFSFENQKDYYDSSIDSFNRNAFHQIIREYIGYKKSIYIFSFTYSNYDFINSLYGHEKGSQYLKEVNNIISKSFKRYVFHSRANTLSIFLKYEPSGEAIDNVSKAIKALNKNGIVNEYFFSVIDTNKYITVEDEIYDYLNFMIRQYTNLDSTQIGSYFQLTDEIVKAKKNYDKLQKLVANAIDNKQFEVYYQPIYDTINKKIHSAEALIRYKKNKDDEYISPEDFIPIAEENGMILQLSDFMLDQVAQDISIKKLSEHEIDFIEVNLSRIELVMMGITKRLTKILNKYHISTSSMNFEITETAQIRDSDIFYNNLKELINAGFTLSMDDFGTGFANIDQLNAIDYRIVKLDKSIIWPAFDNNQTKKSYEKSRKILETTIELLTSMNVEIVAEGIETKEMADYMAMRGVRYLQGYYYSKPLCIGDFISYINDFHNL